MKNWYVYKILFEDDSFYIGYRGCSSVPENDFLKKYFSSSKIVKEKIKAGVRYEGIIIKEFFDKKEAYTYEQALIRENFNSEKILNRCCYYGREGFGILSETAINKISESSKRSWASEEFRNRMINIHKKRWDDPNLNLREKQAKRLSEEFWTEERRKDHSDKLKGRPGSKVLKGVAQTEEHKKAVSEALTGRKLSTEHKRKLSEPKPRVCRLSDRKEMSVNHFNRRSE